jgi:hypothetical protein
MALNALKRNWPAVFGLLAIFNGLVLRGIDWLGRYFTTRNVIDIASQHVALTQTLVTAVGVVLIVFNERRLARESYLPKAAIGALTERISSAEETAARQLAAASTEFRGAVDAVQRASDATASALVSHASAIEALALVQFLKRSKPLIDEAVERFEKAWDATFQNAMRPGASARDARHLDQGMRLTLMGLKQFVRDEFALQWPAAPAPPEVLIPPDASEIANPMLRDAFKRAWVLHARETRNIEAMRTALNFEARLQLAQSRVRSYLQEEGRATRLPDRPESR